MASASVRPPRWWYLVAAALLVVGAAVLALSVGLTLRDAGRRIERYQRVPIPGERELRFAEAGTYELFYERPGAFGVEPPTPPVRITIAPAGGGPEVPIEVNVRFTSSYVSKGRSGWSLGSFVIDDPGSFRLEVRAPAGGGRADLAVGQANLGVGWIQLAPLGLFMALGGGTTAVVVAIRRHRDRRRLAARGG